MNRWLDKLRWGVGVTTLGGALALGGFGIVGIANGSGWSEREEHESEEYEYEREEKGFWGSSKTGRSPDPLYAEECGACHLAYPAHLLPARSWDKLMAGLDDHFGDNAELMPDMAQKITAYLVDNAADVNPDPRSTKFMRGLGQDEAPVRITETDYFKRKHDEVPERLVAGNPDVGSFSQCQACHGKDAQRGVFDEDTVDIPGHGRWDD